MLFTVSFQGYNIDPEQKGVLIPSPEEAQLMLDIFKACKRLGSAGKTRDWLNNNGYKTPSYVSRTGRQHGGRHYNKQTVINILTNPVYIGKIKHNGKQYKGRHKPIISNKLFEDVQSVLNISRSTRQNPLATKDHIYLLKGLIRCGKCGAAMVPASAYGRGGKVYYYYQCNRRNRNGKNICDQKMISADTIENGVLGWIKKISLDEKKIKRIVEKATETNSDILIKLKREKRRIQKKVNELKVKKLLEFDYRPPKVVAFRRIHGYATVISLQY